MKSQIIFDTATRSTLAVCACGWRYLSLDKLIAARVAAEHEAANHPESTTARNVYQITATRRRHAK